MIRSSVSRSGGGKRNETTSFHVDIVASSELEGNGTSCIPWSYGPVEQGVNPDPVPIYNEEANARDQSLQRTGKCQLCQVATVCIIVSISVGNA